ncbi:MAG TPA: hypothetical protein VNV85_17055 [Puia sp.]|jgi:hypothetical protein|nr:hypothetical protein [Puia sp.]
MKKRILIFAMLLTGISYSFANKDDDSINKKAIASFNKEFLNARDIKWERKKEFVLATFCLNNDVMFAYYSTNGEMIAIVRNMLSDKLPIAQLLSLKRDYSNFWISNLFEINTSEGTAYYVTVENADLKITLKSEEDGNWETYLKQEKQ